MLPLPGWRPIRRHRRNDPFTRATHGDLDIVMPPPYDMSQAEQQEVLARVEDLLRRLQPGAIDAGSRDVLNNLINSWAHQAIARLDADRDERLAVGDVLVGLAQEELARRKPRYDADYARVLHVYEALDVTFSALTGKKTSDLRAAAPQRVPGEPSRSAVGPVDLTQPWVLPAGPAPYPPLGDLRGFSINGSSAGRHDHAAADGSGDPKAQPGDQDEPR